MKVKIEGYQFTDEAKAQVESAVKSIHESDPGLSHQDDVTIQIKNGVVRGKYSRIGDELVFIVVDALLNAVKRIVKEVAEDVAEKAEEVAENIKEKVEKHKAKRAAKKDATPKKKPKLK